MSSIPLRIVIHGLIALVPTMDPGGANYITALLVDGRNMNQAECMSDHHPKLRFQGKTQECIAAGCRAVSGECLCAHEPNADPALEKDPLVGKQISLEILPAPSLATEKPKSALPAHALPEDSQEAGSFSYIANLSQVPFELTLAPGYLALDPPPQARAHMVARMEVPYKTITACSLAMLEDGGQANVHAMSFRPLHEPSDSSEVSYALAQSVVAELAIPDPGAGDPIVRLHISDFGGANDRSITLVPVVLNPASSVPDKFFRIELANDPDKPLDRDDICDSAVARHFSHFYSLAENPTSPPLIPHARYTRFASSVPLQPKACKEPTFELGNRPICPIATFNP